MKTNVEDFVKNVYKNNFTMRAIHRGEVSGEVTLYAHSLEFTDEYGNDEELIGEEDFDKCDISFTPYGNVKIVLPSGYEMFFEISKRISKEDFETLVN